MKVIIGIDPHKASHTAVAISGDENELGSIKVRSTRRQVPQLLAWAEPFETRRWAIESAGGLGYLLAQQLVDASENVVDVPATLASRVRVLASGRSNKNDPKDALWVAVAALRAPTLRSVQAADHAEVLRLLAKRNLDIGNHRTRACAASTRRWPRWPRAGSPRNSTLLTLTSSSTVSKRPPRSRRPATTSLPSCSTTSPASTPSSRSHTAASASAVKASGTSLTELFGVGPIIACMLIGYTGDVHRFANRDQFAAYNGTAPIELSSGGRVVHRLSQRGNRHLNHAIHMAAISHRRQSNSEGRAYFDGKVTEAKTKKE